MADERKPMVWAFNRAGDPEARKMICESMKGGKSRFGWSYEDEHNLKLEGVWTEEHPKQAFLLAIRKGDWIVHINTPEYNHCIAAEVSGEYGFDEGLPTSIGRDFRHVIPVKPESIIEFERNDPNIVPGVNLNPRQRYHRVYAVDEFLESLSNLRQQKVTLRGDESREEFHLKHRSGKQLSEITELICKTHPGKKLEDFLVKVFHKIPGVQAELNRGWGSDFGADIIVNIGTQIGNIDLQQKVVVQVKAYEDKHYNLLAVDQVRTAIKKFGATAGMIITTGQKTEQLEDAVQKASEDVGRPIDLIAGEDVARFVLKHAPELVFNL